MFSLNAKPRLYQEELFAKAVNNNALIVLPTGLGKTLIALMLSIHRLNQYPDSKVLVMAPTKPLAAQHLKSFVKDSNIKESDCALLTGAIKPELRKDYYHNKRLIFATPQTIESDLLSGKLDFSDYSLIVFDECHRAVGDYAYCFLAQQYYKQAINKRLLGITASPGSDKDKIIEVCNNIHLSIVESRSEQDSDVKPYINKKNITKIYIELPESLQEIIKLLNKALSINLKDLKDLGVLQTHDITRVYKKEVLSVQHKAVELLKTNKYEAYSILSASARVLKVMHALELLQTQGVTPLTVYFEGLKKQNVKAAKSLLMNVYFRQAMQAAFKTSDEHPKFNELIKLINSKPKETYLLFTQYRATAERIVEVLSKNSFKAKLFVGQRGSNGMSQKKQLEILDKFKSGEFNILVSTSISEEGLDIPRIDNAVFFEPIPSALRSVQRRGRVGRAKTGNVYVLITKGTIDEKYHWTSYYKEKRMKNALDELRSSKFNQSGLNKFF